MANAKKNKWILHEDNSYVGEWLIDEKVNNIPVKTQQLLQKLKEFCIPIHLNINLLVGETDANSQTEDMKKVVNVNGFSPEEVKDLILHAESNISSKSENIYIHLSMRLNAFLSLYSADNKIITEYYPTKKMLIDIIKKNDNNKNIISLFSPIGISIYPSEIRFLTFSNIWIPGILPSEGNEELAQINGPRLKDALHIFEKTFDSNIIRWQSGQYNIDKYGFPGGYDTRSDFGRSRDGILKKLHKNIKNV